MRKISKIAGALAAMNIIDGLEARPAIRRKQKGKPAPDTKKRAKVKAARKQRRKSR